MYNSLVLRPPLFFILQFWLFNIVKEKPVGKSSCTFPVAVWFSLSSHHPLLCPLNSSAIDGIHTATDGVLICSCGLLSFATSPSRRPRSWCLTGCVTGVRMTLQSLELAISFTFNIRVILTHRQTGTYGAERSWSELYKFVDILLQNFKPY